MGRADFWSELAAGIGRQFPGARVTHDGQRFHAVYRGRDDLSSDYAAGLKAQLRAVQDPDGTPDEPPLEAAR